MANNVFANGREVACKAADGKAIAAFPDVAFTPPQTPATPPGVPIPYPNTAFAKDTTSGSKKVKISGKEVMLKNKSYFKTSTGDEAGSAPKKGIITSKIKGKAYFNMWSMDVKVEGENVVRHLDLTTHNHGSVPGNSPTWPYLDDMSVDIKNEKCGDEMAAVETHCQHSATKGETHKDCPVYYKDSSKNEGYGNDPCIKAKRCMLVPYNRGPTTGGCCPGQTPHHIVPKHHFKGNSKYSQNNAPCVCVEGHSWHDNDRSSFPDTEKTHHKMHAKQDTAERLRINLVQRAQAAGKDTKGFTPEEAMNYQQAKAVGIKSHSETFPDCDPKCSEKCMAAQIDAYHAQEEVGIKESDPVKTKPYGNKIEDMDEVEQFWAELAEKMAQ